MTSFFSRMSHGGVGTNINDTSRALTEDQLRSLVPSVFARSAHESRSERFQPIPTYDVVEELNKQGFSVVGARQSVSRDASKREFTKHLLRLRRLDEADKLVRDGTAFEVLLKNANDGTSAYDLLAGLWRFVCGNGLMVGDTFSSVKVRHSGNVVSKVVEGTYEVLDQAQLLLAAPDKFGSIGLTGQEQLAFATAAHQLRFDEPEEGAKPAIQPAQLLEIRRPEDRTNDLWTVYNRVQENAVKGGLTGRATDANGRRSTRMSTTRQIKGIDQDVKLNRALWTLTEFFAEQKAKQAA